MAGSRWSTGAVVVLVVCVSVGVLWAISGSATPVATYAGCVDVLAPDPGLSEVFLGMRSFLAARPGSAGQFAPRSRPDDAVEEALRADPEQIIRRRAVLDRMPVGGYAAYVRAVCPVQREFEAGEPGVSQVRWAMAFDAVTICLWSPDHTPTLPQPLPARTANAEATDDLRDRYSRTRLDAARRYLCPR